MLQELFSLCSKTVLVTGASSGLGRSMAQALAQVGASIIAVGRNQQRLNELAESVEGMGAQIKTYSVDFNKSSEISKFTDLLAKEQQKVDVLINNAGIVQMTDITDGHLEAWDNIININLKSVWQLSQQIAQQMIAQNIHGSIINISSINGADVPYATASAYSATKAAVIQLSKVLAGALARHNIRVNTVVPGLFYTEMTADIIESVKGTREDLTNQIPLKFIAQPEDLNPILLYLASNKASRYVTGANFVVDGGISANCRGA